MDPDRRFERPKGVARKRVMACPSCGIKRKSEGVCRKCLEDIVRRTSGSREHARRCSAGDDESYRRRLLHFAAGSAVPVFVAAIVLLPGYSPLALVEITLLAVLSLVAVGSWVTMWLDLAVESVPLGVLCLLFPVGVYAVHAAEPGRSRGALLVHVLSALLLTVGIVQFQSVTGTSLRRLEQTVRSSVSFPPV